VVGKPEGERLFGRPRRGWKDNSKMKTLFRSEFRNVLGNLEGILSDYTPSNTTLGIHVYLDSWTDHFVVKVKQYHYRL
jgi:hypothetical protein